MCCRLADEARGRAGKASRPLLRSLRHTRAVPHVRGGGVYLSDRCRRFPQTFRSHRTARLVLQEGGEPVSQQTHIGHPLSSSDRGDFIRRELTQRRGVTAPRSQRAQHALCALPSAPAPRTRPLRREVHNSHQRQAGGASMYVMNECSSGPAARRWFSAHLPECRMQCHWHSGGRPGGCECLCCAHACGGALNTARPQRLPQDSSLGASYP